MLLFMTETAKDRRTGIADRAQDKAAAPVEQFLSALAATPRSGARGRPGRLLFSLDATMSRQPTWDRAQAIQAEMFEAAAALGGLVIKLVYFRGHRECRASGWTSDGAALARLMGGIACRGGITQIGRMLAHARAELEKGPVDAIVHIGDACEEPADPLCNLAGEIGLKGTPIFLFQEGRDGTAHTAFAEIARLTRGAHLRFDALSAERLRMLLRAVAAYAAGGRAALTDERAGAEARLLLGAMEHGS